MMGMRAAHKDGATGFIVGRGQTIKGKRLVLLAPTRENEDEGKWYDLEEIVHAEAVPVMPSEKASPPAGTH